VSHGLSFAASTDFKPIRDYIASESFLSHPLWTAYVASRQDLLDKGAVESEPPETDSQQQQQQQQQQPQPTSQDPPTPRAGPTEGPNRSDRTTKPKPPVLPTLDDVLSPNSVEPLGIPPQLTLTRMVQKAHPRWTAASLSEEGKTLVAHLSRQTLKLYAETGETATYLQGIAKFDKEQEIQHSPLGFLAHGKPCPTLPAGLVCCHPLVSPGTPCAPMLVEQGRTHL